MIAQKHALLKVTRINGMGEEHEQGSYVLIELEEIHGDERRIDVRLSEGAAEHLMHELKAVVR